MRVKVCCLFVMVTASLNLRICSKCDIRLKHDNDIPAKRKVCCEAISHH